MEIISLPPALQSGWFVPHVVTYFVAYAGLFASFALAGVNHKTAPVWLREKVVLPPGGEAMLEAIKTRLGLTELIVLSTCNRTEFYWTSTSPVAPIALFTELCPLGPENLLQLGAGLYTLKGLEAARHLFDVVCGLDSLVTGETQILNQVKRAYERSRHHRRHPYP